MVHCLYIHFEICAQRVTRLISAFNRKASICWQFSTLPISGCLSCNNW